MNRSSANASLVHNAIINSPKFLSNSNQGLYYNHAQDFRKLHIEFDENPDQKSKEDSVTILTILSVKVVFTILREYFPRMLSILAITFVQASLYCRRTSKLGLQPFLTYQLNNSCILAAERIKALFRFLSFDKKKCGCSPNKVNRLDFFLLH